MSSSTEISNLAISHLGIGKEIQNLDTDDSEEAISCRRYYEPSLKYILRGFNWSFANRTETLNLVETSPNTEWGYSYRYPSNALKIIKLLSGVRNEHPRSRAVYKMSGDDTAKLIFTDEVNAVCEYTKHITDTSLFPDDFIMAFSYRLAFNIVAKLTAGDPFQIKGQMQKQYLEELSYASANDLNEQQDDFLPDSQFILARD